MKDINKGQPEYGKQYALTGITGKKCIMNGNTWAESEITDEFCKKCGDIKTNAEKFKTTCLNYDALFGNKHFF